MSSDDERFGAEVAGVLLPPEGLMFPKQVDWIRALIGYVEKRPDLCLIVRVHPREFPNKREGVLSDHAVLLQAALASLPRNVRVNWPTENVPLYDLAAITDVFANGWSSAGKEMTSLGLPVVLYSPDLALYPSDLNYVGRTREEYFSQIERALEDGWDPERIRKIYRWYAVEFRYSTLDISESFSKNEHGSFLRKVSSRLLRTVAPTLEQEIDCRRRARHLCAAGKVVGIVHRQLDTAADLELTDPAVLPADETRSLKGEVRRLVEGLYGPAGSSQDNVLANRLRAFADG